MDEADTHPLHDHACCSRRNLAEPSDVDVPVDRVVVGNQFREVGSDREIGELAKLVDLSPRRKDLEVAETNEAGGHPTHHGPQLRCRVAVIEHVAHDLVTGEHEAEGASRRHSEVMHGLAAQELANARSQHRHAVGGSRERCGTRPLQLEGEMIARRRLDFAERDCSSVAELSGPVAELMAAVDHGEGVGACGRPCTAEGGDEVVTGRSLPDIDLGIEAQLRHHLGGEGNEAGSRRHDGVDT